MRTMRAGKCERCGAEGGVWVSKPKTLDFGVPDAVPIETVAIGLMLCDECEYSRSPAGGARE